MSYTMLCYAVLCHAMLRYGVDLLHERLHLGRGLEAAQVQTRQNAPPARRRSRRPVGLVLGWRSAGEVDGEGLSAGWASHRLLRRHRCDEVGHAAAAESVAARRKHGLLRVLEAQPTHQAARVPGDRLGRGRRGGRGLCELVAAALRVEDEVRVVDRLTIC